jgi:uncharacterized protein
MPITALYAAVLTGLFVFLSARVIGQRRAQRVEIGDGADRELLRRVRVHGNFVEYAPLALVLMGLAEGLGAPKLLVHALGLSLLIGRTIHAYGLSQTPHVMPLRAGGMVMTFVVLLAAAVTCAVLALMSGKLV